MEEDICSIGLGDEVDGTEVTVEDERRLDPGQDDDHRFVLLPVSPRGS